MTSILVSIPIANINSRILVKTPQNCSVNVPTFYFVVRVFWPISNQMKSVQRSLVNWKYRLQNVSHFVSAWICGKKSGRKEHLKRHDIQHQGQGVKWSSNILTSCTCLFNQHRNIFMRGNNYSKSNDSIGICHVVYVPAPPINTHFRSVSNDITSSAILNYVT